MIPDHTTEYVNSGKVSFQQSQISEDTIKSKFTESSIRDVRNSPMTLSTQAASNRQYCLNPLMSAVAVECVGSFLLALTVPLTVKNNPEMSSIGIGFFLASLIFTFGYISGGQFNPMTTTSLWLSMSANEIGDTLSGYQYLVYVGAQMLGGTLGSSYCILIEGKDFIVPSLGENLAQIARGFLSESMFTFLLCTAALHTTDKRQYKNNFYGFAIGFVVLCGGLSRVSTSNGAFNVAVTTPLTMLRLFSLNKSILNQIENLFVYWLSGITGSVAASLLYLSIQSAQDD